MIFENKRKPHFLIMCYFLEMLNNHYSIIIFSVNIDHLFASPAYDGFEKSRSILNYGCFFSYLSSNESKRSILLLLFGNFIHQLTVSVDILNACVFVAQLMQVLILAVDDFLHAFDLVNEVVHFIVFELLQDHHESDTNYIAVELLQCSLAGGLGRHERGTFVGMLEDLFDLFILEVFLEVLDILRSQPANVAIEKVLMKDIIGGAYLFYYLSQFFPIHFDHFFTKFLNIAFVIAVLLDIALLRARVVYLGDELLRQQTSSAFLLFLPQVHYIIITRKKNAQSN